MRSATREAHRASALLLVTVLLLSALPATARAAQEEEGQTRLRLGSLPISHSPGDGLGATLRVVNQSDVSLEGFSVTVSVSNIIRSRSDLHASFDGTTISFATSFDFTREIPPGGMDEVIIDLPVDDLGLEAEGGVHALTFSLLSLEDSGLLDELITQLMFYPEPPEEPLNHVTVVPLNEAPARGPEGTFPLDDEGRNGLEDALTGTGWLPGFVGALDAATKPPPEPEPEPDRDRRGRPGKGRRNRPRPTPTPVPEPDPPLRMAFAPTPRLLEELAVLSDGYRRSEDGEVEEIGEDSPEATAAREVLRKMRAIVAREGVQPVLVPYSFPDLPILEEEMTPGDIGVQLTEAITVLDETLGVAAERDWVYAPAGRLDAGSLEALQTAGVTTGSFFYSDVLSESFEPSGTGCPEPVLSFVCPIRVETNVGSALNGYVFDPDLQRRMLELTTPGAGRVELQRLLAETAMIHAEQPGTPGRVIHMAFPATWRPPPALARTTFAALREAPWLVGVTPEEGLDVATNQVRRSIVDEAPPLLGQPDDTYFSSIVDTQDLIESFSSFIGEQGPRGVLERLRRNILVAQGRTLWGDFGDIAFATSFITTSREEARAEMGKVTLAVPSETTFTSRAGSIEVSLFNETGYPVEAQVLLESLDMEFNPATIEFTADDPLAEGTTRLSVDAEAQTSGTFPITVTVATAGGDTLASESIQVRSTEFNVVALAITFGAVGFLILFYVVKAVRRRRNRTRAAEAPTT